jgi:uncharacterized protein (TIGR03084 family)
MEDVVVALADQQAELSALLGGRPEADWRIPTRCEGWDVSDVVLHLAQSNEIAIASATGRFAEAVAELAEGVERTGSVDDGVARLVDRQRGLPVSEILERWSAGASELLAVFDAMDLSTRVHWVAGELAARTLVTTRMTETWIHTGDVADAFGVTLPATDRLRLIARLAWRTLPYAFSSAGRAMAGPVAFRLEAPDGGAWDFLPEEARATSITGAAVVVCVVAARRVDASATSLSGEGPDVDDVLALVRTYA